jgi:transcriptional regulator with XRE-family HTH domain
MVLGGQLRRLREAAGISRADAGYAIRSSESKMSRVELGRVGFKERDIADLLTMYGVNDPVERESFLEMVRQSNLPGWWRRYTDVIPGWFNDYVGLEESASRIQGYEHQFVPGLLQTADYARSVLSQGRLSVDDDDIDRRVTLRLRRQKILARPDAPKLWVVLDESVLHRAIGGRQVMKAQIENLLELTNMRHISLQILKYEHGGHAAEGAFSVLRFAEVELPTIVYVEHLTGALYLDRLDEIEVYSRVLDRLAVDAETPEQSRQTLSKFRAEM